MGAIRLLNNASDSKFCRLRDALGPEAISNSALSHEKIPKKQVLRIGWPGGQNTRMHQGHHFTTLKRLNTPQGDKFKKYIFINFIYF